MNRSLNVADHRQIRKPTLQRRLSPVLFLLSIACGDPSRATGTQSNGGASALPESTQGPSPGATAELLPNCAAFDRWRTRCQVQLMDPDFYAPTDGELDYPLRCTSVDGRFWRAISDELMQAFVTCFDDLDCDGSDDRALVCAVSRVTPEESVVSFKNMCEQRIVECGFGEEFNVCPLISFVRPELHEPVRAALQADCMTLKTCVAQLDRCGE